MAEATPLKGTASVANGEWNNHFFWPCGLKGAGCYPCICPNCICPCMPMMWASAMTQIKGKDYDYWTCCLGAQCCPVCTFMYALKDVSEHYGFVDPYWFIKVFPLFALYQVFDTVLVKEGLHMVVAAVEPDTIDR